MSTNTPQELKYAESHEWIKADGAVGTVGITDYAQSELGDVVYIELPKVGQQVKAKAAVAVVESVKAASDIYSPVTGEVTEINSAVKDDPALINKDPYGKAWLYKIKIADVSELKLLKDAAGYAKQIAG
jgi:glycine cleavage system H protein